MWVALSLQWMASLGRSQSDTLLAHGRKPPSVVPNRDWTDGSVDNVADDKLPTIGVGSPNAAETVNGIIHAADVTDYCCRAQNSLVVSLL